MALNELPNLYEKGTDKIKKKIKNCSNLISQTPW